jgi:hypothetical protein
MMICHSVLDTESKLFRNKWIPAFAGMTAQKGYHEKQTQFKEFVPLRLRG